MRHSFSVRLIPLALFATLSACESTNDWLNRNMPVIGQRCEHWQCFTESGQEQSQINEQERLQREAAQNGTAPPPGAQYPAGNPATNNPIAANPAPTAAATPSAPALAATATPPQQPLAPAAPEEPVPTYKYVPRTPSAPGSTPFDGAIPPPVGQ